MSASVTEVHSPIELTVSKNGAIKRFANVEEFGVWVNDEQARWQWLAKAREQAPHLKPVYISQLSTLASQAQHYFGSSGADPAGRSSIAQGIAAVLSSAVSGGSLLTSESTEGQLVLQLADERPVAAGYTLAYFLGAQLQDNSPPRDSFDGRLLAALSTMDLGERLKAGASAALRQLHSQHSQALAKLETDGEGVKAELHTLRDELRTDNEKRRTDFMDAEIKRGLQATEQQQTNQTAFDNMLKAMHEHMKLKAPVRYWKQSAKWHRISAVIFGVLSVGWGLAVGLQAVVWATDLLNRRAADGKTVLAVQAWEIGLYLLLITLAVWLLRVLVRVMLSNLHQGADAASRATMTEAYLALISEGKALPDQDRILVLTTLFRPMATGLIKDDGMPPSLVELLSRVVGGKQ